MNVNTTAKTTTVVCRNEVNGTRRIVRIAQSRIETLLRLKCVLAAQEFDLYNDLSSAYAVVMGERITVYIYGFDQEAALGLWQKIMGELQGRALA